MRRMRAEQRRARVVARQAAIAAAARPERRLGDARITPRVRTPLEREPRG